MFFEGVVFAWERPLPKHKLSIELSIYMFYQEERSNVWRAVLEVSICIHLLQLQHTYCQIAATNEFFGQVCCKMGPQIVCPILGAPAYLASRDFGGSVLCHVVPLCMSLTSLTGHLWPFRSWRGRSRACRARRCRPKLLSASLNGSLAPVGTWNSSATRWVPRGSACATCATSATSAAFQHPAGTAVAFTSFTSFTCIMRIMRRLRCESWQFSCGLGHRCN